jgi:hypothetical protein
VATAQILLQRFFYVSSLKQFGVAVRVDHEFFRRFF